MIKRLTGINSLQELVDVVNILIDAENARALVVVEEPLPKNTIIDDMSNLLRDIGIPKNLKGYKCIIQALFLIEEDPDIMTAVTKELYPQIARILKTTGSRVERAMRHAIEVAWARGNVEFINELFGYTVKSFSAKPTNSEFLATIDDYLNRMNK